MLYTILEGKRGRAGLHPGVVGRIRTPKSMGRGTRRHRSAEVPKEELTNSLKIAKSRFLAACRFHTVENDPFIQKSTCLTQLTLGPNVVQIWSRYTLKSSGNETLEVYRVVGVSTVDATKEFLALNRQPYKVSFVAQDLQAEDAVKTSLNNMCLYRVIIIWYHENRWTDLSDPGPAAGEVCGARPASRRCGRDLGPGRPWYPAWHGGHTPYTLHPLYPAPYTLHLRP